jgi:hypothetical protein
MGAPQIIMIAMTAMAVGISLVKQGEPKGDYGIIDWLIGPALQIGILYWGGFFG